MPLAAAGPDPDGRFFLDHWTVSFTPSVRAYLRCAERVRGSKATRLLGVFDPPPGPTSEGREPLPRLAGAQMEAWMLQARCVGLG